MLRSILIGTLVFAPVAVATAVLINVLEPPDAVIISVVVVLSGVGGVGTALIDEHRQRSASR